MSGLGGVWSGGSGPGGVWSRGVCLVLGGCLVPGVSVWGVSAPGGCLLQGGVGCIPSCNEADTPPMNRMTNSSKNITLATTSLRPVIRNLIKTPHQQCRKTHRIRDQSRALEDRNDSNNSLEVYTPNSFIHLFYNSPYMDVVDMHNILIIPSDSVLWKKTVEAS